MARNAAGSSDTLIYRVRVRNYQKKALSQDGYITLIQNIQEFLHIIQDANIPAERHQMSADHGSRFKKTLKCMFFVCLCMCVFV